MEIAGISLEPVDGGPYRIASRQLVVFPYRVNGPGEISRDDLSKLIGCELSGHGQIVGVESFAVHQQTNKTIGLAVREPAVS